MEIEELRKNSPIKTAVYNGHNIRYIEINHIKYGSIVDQAEALEIKPKEAIKWVDNEHIFSHPYIDDLGVEQEMIITSEIGSFELMYASDMSESIGYRNFVSDVAIELRKQAGLEEFQALAMTNEEHHLNNMLKIDNDIMTLENWNGHNIRYVEHKGKWCAVLTDMAKALGLQVTDIIKWLGGENVYDHKEGVVVDEAGTYKMLFASRIPEAFTYREAVFATIGCLSNDYWYNKNK